MRRLLACLAGLCCAATASHADYSVPGGYLNADGDIIVDGENREVILRGVNHIGLRSDRLHPLRSSVSDDYDPALFFEVGDLDDDDFEEIAKLGFNSIRLVVTWEFAEPSVGSWDVLTGTYTGSYDETYFGLIDDFIARAGAHGMSVVFDFGQFGWSRFLGGNAGAPDWAVSETCQSLPGPQPGAPPQASASVGCAYYNFWTNSEATGFPLQEAYAALWRFVAARYAANPIVSMYDIQNEPVGGPIPEGAFEYEFLYPFYRKMAAAIREVDALHPVGFQPVITHSLGVPSPFVEPIGIDNAVYLPHNYSASYFPQRIDPSYTPSQPPITLADLAASRVEATGFGTPLNIGETGWTRSTQADGVGGPIEDVDPNAPPAFAEDLGAASDLLRLGWHWFAWSTNDEAYGVNHGGHVDSRLARALARPFPRATAGRLVSFSFDPATKHYVQETGDPLAGVDSEIALPLEWTYPTGAVVKRNGQVVSEVAHDGTVTGEGAYLSGSRTLVLPSVAGIVEIDALPDAGCEVVEAGAALTPDQRARMIDLRRRFFGPDYVDPVTGALDADVAIASWVTVTTYALAINGQVLLLDPYIGDDSGYVPTHDCELSGLRPDFVLVGHGHFDHAELAPTVLNRNRGAVFIGAAEHCNDVTTALDGLHVPICVEASPRQAPFGTTVHLPPTIPGVEISAIRHPHSAAEPPNPDDPSPIVLDPAEPKPADFGPCTLNCPPPRPNFVEPTEIEDGSVSVLYQFRIGEFALTWNNTNGPNQPGEPALLAMGALPQTDVNLGAILGFNNPTNGFHDARLIAEALRARLIVPGHHDFLLPYSGSAYRSAFHTEMDETPAAIRPGIVWVHDPVDYIDPSRLTWFVDDPLWAGSDPVIP